MLPRLAGRSGPSRSRRRPARDDRPARGRAWPARPARARPRRGGPSTSRRTGWSWRYRRGPEGATASDRPAQRTIGARPRRNPNTARTLQPHASHSAGAASWHGHQNSPHPLRRPADSRGRAHPRRGQRRPLPRVVGRGTLLPRLGCGPAGLGCCGAGRVRPRRRVLLAGAAGSAALVLLWLVSRTSGLPFGPEAGVAEPIGAADTLCVVMEVLSGGLAAVAVTAWAPTRLRRRRRRAGPPSSPAPSPP